MVTRGGARRQRSNAARDGAPRGVRSIAAMLERARFHLRQWVYDLSTGLLFRPAVIIAGLAGLAVALSMASVGRASWLFPGEPAAAQVVLGTIASSMMTVVSVVYSILLVALSLASMQFSTRILRRFVRDEVSQVTLGLFLGTFVYCLLLLRVVHGEPRPHVPALGVSVAVALAVVSMGWLVYFIHHISRIIQANHLVDEIAAETEPVIDEVFPAEAGAEVAAPDGWTSWLSHTVTAARSGYVQLVDTAALADVALRAEGFVVVDVGVGHFAVEGAPLVTLRAPRAPSPDDVAALRDAFDLGATRTMQDDAEFGVRQIVDIALKAISPAVNDPSTAATCIDHLARLVGRAARRRDPSPLVAPAGSSVARVQHDPSSFRALVDLAFAQIRQYGRADMAVGLRVLRALEVVAGCTDDPARLAHLARHARQMEDALRASFPSEDCAMLAERARRLEALVGRGQ